MIPLRRYLISREHGKLPYPEGTACAEVQVAGDAGGSNARLLFSGLGLGALYQVLANRNGLGLWNEGPHVQLPAKAQIGGDFTPELLGVGFIIGPRIAAIMFGGSALAWLVMIPAISLWAGDATVYPASAPMSSLSSGEIWSYYLRYVGAGAVGCAGIVTLIKSLPTIVESVRLGMGQMRGASGGAGSLPRTQQDLPMKLVLGLAALMAAALWLWPGVPVNLLGGVLIVVFSFFFVTVSSRIVGLIGSSSNPVSGMTIAALLLTSLIWVALGLNDGGAATKVERASDLRVLHSLPRQEKDLELPRRQHSWGRLHDSVGPRVLEISRCGLHEEGLSDLVAIRSAEATAAPLGPQHAGRVLAGDCYQPRARPPDPIQLFRVAANAG